ncbi:DNA polymerase/3'-5' exonuclease PolX [Desulfofalx alkaliphila]|uniref:DNA polymerase/3'-5' exonuclease PolX n=1 Tax=Desulfofalx alkaliphila TaxID=105483 RepID=UPI0004E20DE2|nr:DNA polymerase/3'-5' exonuclease PolX [Desulfofalx alkaliphila]
MQNVEVSWIFHEIADLLEIKGGDFFKIRAYRNAAKTIYRLEQPLDQLVRSGEINKLPGIGKAIAAKIEEIIKTGTCKTHQELLEEIPRGVLEITSLPGIGPKKARLLFKKLGVLSLDQLEQAAKDRQVRKVPGMSSKTELEILRNIKAIRSSGEKTVLGLAREIGAELRKYLLSLPGVKRVEIGGSTRRWREAVSDLDLVVAAEQASLVIAAMLKHPRVTEVLDQSERSIKVLTWWGVPVELSVVPPHRFVLAWHRNSGSKNHYRQLQKLAKEKGIELSHGGLSVDGKPVEVKDEADIYRALGMQYIPPEIREDRGEIEAAKTGTLPKLVEIDDIKGDLHSHTTWSDASASLEEMVAAAKNRGYEYLAVTDHSGSLKIANGLDEKRLAEQCKVIERLNRQEEDFTILTGVECDILSDGRLDHPDRVLEELDVVVASVHRNFKMDKKAMTDRIIAAIEHEHVDIIGHVTGRLLGRRSGYEVDMEKVLEAAAKYNTVLEINSSPERLDLNEDNAALARDLGVKIAINTDAHDTGRLEDIIYGVAVARRAWLGPEDVVNTLEVDELLKTLR